MVLYGVVFMTLYSVMRKPELLRQATCSNEHPVSSAAALNGVLRRGAA
jgi:hypothetical protein